MLVSLGLNDAQAKAYLTLTQYGSLTPPELAVKIKESRSNTYKVLDKLAELRLVHKVDAAKKLVYRASNPSSLEALSKKQRDLALAREDQVRQAMPKLLTFFYTYSEQPGVRFFTGSEGIKHIFNDMLRTRQDIYLVRSPADVSFYDEHYFERFRRQRAKLGIKTYAITPDLANANHNPVIDEANLFQRTWIGKEDYTSSVEWNAYGNKLAIISYGEEAIGMIIDSPQIAASFKQLFELTHKSRL